MTQNDVHALAECQHVASIMPKKEGLLLKNKLTSFSSNESTKPWRMIILINGPDEGL